MKPIIEYLSNLYRDQWIPSHDLSHHYRVWQNAKYFFEVIGSGSLIDDEYFSEKLIISCFFHDTGLLKDRGELHGKLSRNICENFLQQYKDKVQFDTLGMLEAIENHDKKNYQNSSDKSFNAFFDILSIADDFDAFGAIGAYRYLEIYLIRGINPNLITENILKNAAGRYSNFVQVMNKIPVQLPSVAKRYEVLRTLLSAQSYGENPESLVDWVNENIVKPKNSPTIYMQNINTKLLSNNRISSFIDKYNNEVNG